MWLHVSVYPQIKGLDLVIDALPAFPNARLVVVGLSADARRGRSYARQAKRLGCRDRVHFVGYSEQIPEIMAAADLLVHPARLDVSGTVILEAICNGLPVIVSSNCGFARHVANADAGRVLVDVTDRREMRKALASADPLQLRLWSDNALRYASKLDVTEGFNDALGQMLRAR